MFTFRNFVYLLFAPSLFFSANAAPPVVNYAGQVAVQGEPFEGIGSFKFALVSGQGTATISHWSNDGSSTAGSEPDANVSVQVSGGLYSILLGNASIPGMSSLDPAIFSSHSNLQLRVWFSDGANGFQQLTPDRTFASVPYALNAGSVNLGSGSISRSMLASDILNDLNGIIGKDRLSQQVLVDLNRTITLAILEPSLKSALSTSSVSTTISGDLNITNQDVIFASRTATETLTVNLPSAAENDGRTIRLIPTNNKTLRIESITGELNGADWANLYQPIEILSNQGVWVAFGDTPQFGVRGKVKDIWPGSSSSSPHYLTDVNGTLFFRAQDDTNGSELWKSDGTQAGTTLVKDIYPGSSWSSPHYLTDVNGTLFFSAQDPEGEELWKFDP